jgi:hypothetical protein
LRSQRADKSRPKTKLRAQQDYRSIPHFVGCVRVTVRSLSNNPIYRAQVEQASDRKAGAVCPRFDASAYSCVAGLDVTDGSGASLRARVGDLRFAPGSRHLLALQQVTQGAISGSCSRMLLPTVQMRLS